MCPLRHRDLVEGPGGVLGVCDGWVVEVQEVDGAIGHREPGL